MTTKRFEHQVVAVTGGAQGLGLAIARRFGQEGARVALIDVQADKVETSAANLQAEGVAAMALVADVTDQAAVTQLAQTLLDRWGRIDVIVNNAGVYTSQPLDQVSPQAWQLTLNVSLTGAMHCAQAVAPIMRQQGRGRIINMSSLAGKTGFPNSSAYCTAKAGLIGLTRALAVELGPAGITVNAIAPGHILTEMLEKVDAAITGQTGQPAGSWIEARRREIPLGRLGTPEEVAALAAFIASDEASFLNGQTISLDGGLLPG